VTPETIRNWIKSEILSLWPTVRKASSFLNGDSIISSLDDGSGYAQKANQFIADNGIVINVGTVHSAKGETHRATLYLETYYQRETDATRLIEFLKGNPPKKELGKRLQQNLKIAHVAFSRPTHLLAFACRASSISGHEEGLTKNGWVIRTVSELTKKEGDAS